jgi:hypothetical protein
MKQALFQTWSGDLLDLRVNSLSVRVAANVVHADSQHALLDVDGLTAFESFAEFLAVPGILGVHRSSGSEVRRTSATIAGIMVFTDKRSTLGGTLGVF